MARSYSAFVCFCLNALLLLPPAFGADVVSTWNGSGNWSDPARWNSNPVVPNNGAQTFDAIINSGSATLDLNVTIEKLTLGGSSTTTITGDSNLALNDLFTWTNGAMTGAGITTANGSIAISGTAVGVVRTLGRTLINNSTANWTGSRGLTFSNGTFDNNNTFTINSSSGLSADGTGLFINDDTFNKQGSGTANFNTGVVFNNTGLVDVQQGSLGLNAGGTHTGDFTIASGATLNLTGTHAVEGTSGFAGLGTVRVTGGTTSFNGTTAIDSAFVFDTLTGIVGGTGTVTLNGPSTWSTGTMSGSGQTILGSGATLLLDPTAVGESTQFQRSFVNDGAITYAGTRSVGISTATLQNNGTFTVNSGLSASGDGVFANAGTFTKLGAGLAAINGITFHNSGLVDVQAGTLSLNGGGTHTGDFTLATGTTLTFTGTHIVEGMTEISGLGTFRITSGTTTVNGTTDVGSNFTFDATIGTIDGAGTLHLAGSSTWTDGVMSGAGQTIVDLDATILFNPTDVGESVDIERSFTNNGMATWSGSKSLIMTDATFQNNNTFTVTSGFSASGTGAFENAGTFTKLGGGSASFTGVAFNNAGLVDVQQASLSLNAGTHTGDFTIASGATLTFTGTHIVEGTAEVSGPGSFRITGGTTTFNDSIVVASNFTFDATIGTIDGAGTLHLAGSSTWTDGAMSGSGQTIVDPDATILFNPTDVGESVEIERSFINNGTATWNTSAARSLVISSGVTLQNNASFLVNSSLATNGTGTFANVGTFTKSGSAVATVSQIAFNNSGTVNVQGGTLTLSGGGTHTGDFTIAAGAILSFNGTHTFSGTNSITGAGTFSLSSTTTNFNGATTVQSALSLGSFLATLSGTGSVTLTGATTWTNGTMAGSGQTIVGPGGSLAISGSGLGIIHQLDRTLVNDNIVTWTGSHLMWNNGTFQNNASVTVNAASGIDSYGTGGASDFNNGGTFTKQGAGLLWFREDVAFNNSGTVDIQAGSLRFDSGGMHSGNFAVPTGTSLTFSGTHAFTATSNVTGTGTFSNLGTVDVQSGTLTIQPTITQHVGTQLASGVWKVRNDSTLNITSGLNITTNLADVTIEGIGSSFAKLNSLVNNQGSLAILGGNQFIAGGAFSNSGTVTVGTDSTIAAASGYNQSAGGTLRGSGTLAGNVQNAGTIRPGNSPGILTIEGDITLQSTSLLEIEVGGLVAGTEHDKVIVTGNATLGGRLELPIINGFVPPNGEHITILTGSTVSGDFNSVFASNLGTVSPNTAMLLVKNPTNVELHFVPKLTNVEFASESPTSEWSVGTTWDNGIGGDAVPDTVHVITVDNLAGVAQRVDVQNDDAFMHSLDVASSTETITVGIKSSRSLSAIVNATVGDRAVIELDNGNLVSAIVSVESGGTLAGNGTVTVNTLSVSGGTLRPGFSVGHLDVAGNYQQGAGGTMLIDVAGDESGEFDTVNVSGALQLGGTLRIDATNLTMPAPGTTFEIIAAGSLAEGEVFDSVETINNNDIFFAPIYTPVAPGSGSDIGGGGAIETRVAVGVYYNGDMNRNGLIDTPDVQAFALALTKPIQYFSSFYLFGSESGDLNHDGRLDFDDIEFFAALVQGTGATAGDIARAIQQEMNDVPEPSSALLILGGFAILIEVRKSRFRLPRSDLA